MSTTSGKLLEVTLTPEERATVVSKSEFAYMKENEEVFEMAAPNFFTVQQGSYFVSGKSGRERDVGPAERARIVEFVTQRLEGSPYPLAEYYPDIS